MKFRRKRAVEDEPTHPGVATAVAAGASRESWIREAIHQIAGTSGADRVGIWLETSVPGSFRGLVWDRDREETPSEWQQLSMEAPLPHPVLTGAASVEVDLEASSECAVLAPLLELRRALWVPVQAQGNLRGLILAGAKQRAAQLSPKAIERVAAELALALELEEERWKARNYHADLALTREILQALASGAVPEALLERAAETCSKLADDAEGQTAIRAAIGITEVANVARESRPPRKLNFLWSTGDSTTRTVMQSDPIHETLRTALQTRRMVGTEVRGAASQGFTGRGVAIPLMGGDEVLGVLAAVLPADAASLATLERLELRALLAAAVLSQKQSAQEEARSAAVQQLALHASAQALLLLNRHGDVLGISASTQDLLEATGAPPARPPLEKIGQPFAGFLHASERDRLGAWLQPQMMAGVEDGVAAARSLEVELLNGTRVRLHPLGPSANGSVLLLVEPAGAQAAGVAPENVETELRNVIEWLEEGVVLFDARDNVRAMNLRFEQMVGLASDESGKYQTLAALIGRLEGQAADPLAFAERWRSLARGLEGGAREELQMLRPVPRVLERSARPILDNSGRLLGRVEIYRDLTAQRVFQSKLLQTEKLAALGQMLTGVAHELSNPLTTVLGYAQRLLTRKDLAGQSEEARQIFQEAERASRILRQLLSHARETPPERRSLSLNQVVLRTMELQRFGLAAGKIHVELDLDPVLPLVRGDAGQLQQVLMNLLGNAQQALEQQGRGGTIRVRTRHESGSVTITVEDTGPGIPQAILARVFDPFFTTKPAGVGTGLGLSIVLSIAREHGGQVRVASPPGKGASFTIELPALALRALPSVDLDPRGHSLRRSDRGERQASTLAVAAPALGHSERSGQGKRILVVEDEPTVARLIADVLEEEGFTVRVLLDGREALEQATSESFDLVICDMKMPGLDGQHFYRSLKRGGNSLANSFLFVTGDTIGPQTRAFLSQNHLVYLSKPFRMEELTEQVWRALEHSSPGGRAAVASKQSAARNG